MTTIDPTGFWESGPRPAQWWQQHLTGRVTEHVIESRALAGNHLGDPTTRPLWVYTPPGYGSSEERYPSVYVIQGYNGQAVMWWYRAPHREGFPAAVDRIFASGDASPCIVVYVDAWTAYGGSQFVGDNLTVPFQLAYSGAVSGVAASYTVTSGTFAVSGQSAADTFTISTVSVFHHAFTSTVERAKSTAFSRMLPTP